jgi:D-lactate dehydrogenase
MITAHQAFFTSNALTNIADTTLDNITNFEQGKDCLNQVCPEKAPRLRA